MEIKLRFIETNGLRMHVAEAGQGPPVVLCHGWPDEMDVDFYANEFKRTGFRGGLNWYRNIDRNWELFAPWSGAKVTVPALYIAGDRDLVLAFLKTLH